MIRVIARLTLARMRRGRALWAALAIAMLPAAAAIVFRGRVHGESDRIEMLNGLYVPQLLVLAVIPAMFVAAPIGEEIEEKTITYLWSRPLPRWHVIAGKLVALAPVAVAITLAGWLLAVQIGLDERAPTDTLVGLGGAALAISMISAGIATLAPKHGMALTIIYMLLFDLPIGEIPASLQILSVSHQARAIAGGNTTALVTMAVLASIWLAIGLVRLRRLEA
jgi:ABC-2 type transport system permease protein